MVKANPISHFITSMLLFTALCSAASGKIIYVDDGADGTDDGTNWENAYVYLQDALADANSAEKPVEIRVAQGIYKPDMDWMLDEAEGDIAHDIAGDNHGKLYGGPAWQPVGGKIGGALLLDGIDDYVSTDFVLDPANGPFSVFAWINGGSAGQVVISQANGTGSGEIWLGADALLGKLMTGLVPPPAGRFVLQPLVSEFVITDNQWHNIGFVWDGSYRTLYADGAEVAKDTAIQNLLKSADGGLYIGAGKTLEPMAFFSGLIDDVRIYNMAVTEDEIGTLVH
jgi:hypothetical protein